MVGKEFVSNCTCDIHHHIGTLRYNRQNENRVDEMCHITDKLHTLVPKKTTISHFTLSEGESEAILGETFHQQLLGGD